MKERRSVGGSHPMPPVQYSCWVASVSERGVQGAITPCSQHPAAVGLHQRWRHAPFGCGSVRIVKVGGGGYAERPDGSTPAHGL